MPDTHNPAAQASAARILRQLRFDFSAAALSEKDTEYLNTVLDEIQRPEPDKYPGIQGILGFIRAVLDSKTPPFSTPEKRTAVFQEIKHQVLLGKDHWTQNTFYDAEGTPQIIDASLAETLNLVCLALFYAEARYEALGQNEPQDIEARQLSLFNCLEALFKDPKCTGGRQHDVLYLLNGVYPVHDGECYQPLQLIEDLQSFIKGRLGELIAEEIKKEQAWGFALDWVKYQAGLGIEEVRMSAWFEPIREKMLLTLSESLVKYGLNPNDLTTKKYISDTYTAVVDLDVPHEIHPAIADIKALLALKLGASEPRNIQLSGFQAQVNKAHDFTMIDAQLLKGFLEMEHWYQEIQRYKKVTLFVDEQEGVFYQETLPQFAVQIDTYFKMESFDRAAFENAKAKFLEQQKLQKSGHFDLIRDFFVLAQSPTQYQTLMRRLVPQDADRRRLLLDEQMMERWLTITQKAQEEGRSIKITAYEINRLLMDGLLRVESGISVGAAHQKVFCIMTRYLLDTSGNSVMISAFKATYSKKLLSNILLLAHLPKAYQGQIAGISLLFDDGLHKLIQNASRSAEAMAFIFRAIRRIWSEIIQDGWQLEQLFRLPDIVLNAEQRGQIFEALQPNLGNLIQDGWEFSMLFQLSETQLNEAQREQILEAVKHRLDTLIQDAGQLVWLLRLSETQLSETQREQILEAIEPHLATLIQNGEQLLDLFQLSNTQLNSAQRTRILTAMESNLGTLIQNDEQFMGIAQDDAQSKTFIQDAEQLLDLFRLSETQLDTTQRTQILTAMSSQLGILIQDDEQLQKLFQLPETQLNETQRRQILAAVPSDLSLPMSGFFRPQSPTHTALSAPAPSASFC